MRSVKKENYARNDIFAQIMRILLEKILLKTFFTNSHVYMKCEIENVTKYMLKEMKYSCRTTDLIKLIMKEFNYDEGDI